MKRQTQERTKDSSKGTKWHVPCVPTLTLTLSCKHQPRSLALSQPPTQHTHTSSLSCKQHQSFFLLTPILPGTSYKPQTSYNNTSTSTHNHSKLYPSTQSLHTRSFSQLHSTQQLHTHSLSHSNSKEHMCSLSQPNSSSQCCHPHTSLYMHPCMSQCP